MREITSTEKIANELLIERYEPVMVLKLNIDYISGMSDTELKTIHSEWIKEKLDKKLYKEERSAKAYKEMLVQRKLEEIEKLKSEM